MTDPAARDAILKAISKLDESNCTDDAVDLKQKQPSELQPAAANPTESSLDMIHDTDATANVNLATHTEVTDNPNASSEFMKETDLGVTSETATDVEPSIESLDDVQPVCMVDSTPSSTLPITAELVKPSPIDDSAVIKESDSPTVTSGGSRWSTLKKITTSAAKGVKKGVQHTTKKVAKLQQKLKDRASDDGEPEVPMDEVGVLSNDERLAILMAAGSGALSIDEAIAQITEKEAALKQAASKHADESLSLAIETSDERKEEGEALSPEEMDSIPIEKREAVMDMVSTGEISIEEALTKLRSAGRDGAANSVGVEGTSFELPVDSIDVRDETDVQPATIPARMPRSAKPTVQLVNTESAGSKHGSERVSTVSKDSVAEFDELSLDTLTLNHLTSSRGEEGRVKVKTQRRPPNRANIRAARSRTSGSLSNEISLAMAENSNTSNEDETESKGKIPTNTSLPPKAVPRPTVRARPGAKPTPTVSTRPLVPTIKSTSICADIDAPVMPLKPKAGNPTPVTVKPTQTTARATEASENLTPVTEKNILDSNKAAYASTKPTPGVKPPVFGVKPTLRVKPAIVAAKPKIGSKPADIKTNGSSARPGLAPVAKPTARVKQLENTVGSAETTVDVSETGSDKHDTDLAPVPNKPKVAPPPQPASSKAKYDTDVTDICETPADSDTIDVDSRISFGKPKVFSEPQCQNGIQQANADTPDTDTVLPPPIKSRGQRKSEQSDNASAVTITGITSAPTIALRSVKSRNSDIKTPSADTNASADATSAATFTAEAPPPLVKSRKPNATPELPPKPEVAIDRDSDSMKNTTSTLIPQVKSRTLIDVSAEDKPTVIPGQSPSVPSAQSSTLVSADIRHTGSQEASVEDGVIEDGVRDKSDNSPDLLPRMPTWNKVELKREVRSHLRSEKIELWGPPHSANDGTCGISRSVTEQIAGLIKNAQPKDVFEALEMLRVSARKKLKLTVIEGGTYETAPP